MGIMEVLPWERFYVDNEPRNVRNQRALVNVCRRENMTMYVLLCRGANMHGYIQYV